MVRRVDVRGIVLQEDQLPLPLHLLQREEVIAVDVAVVERLDVVLVARVVELEVRGLARDHHGVLDDS